MLAPVRWTIKTVGLLLARGGWIDLRRAVRTSDLAWPRIVTGVARMSRTAVDVAMVGAAVGAPAIAGIGFATPYWVLAFVLGGGIAGGTISLVSQRFSASGQQKEDAGVSAAVAMSAAFAVAATLPLTLWFGAAPESLIRLIGSGNEAVSHGARYLRLVSLSMPFAALNLVASRTLVGAGDAWAPMVVRAGGAAANVALNAVLIFGLGWGVVGAALGTVVTTAAVTGVFAVGLTAGRLPLVGALPVRIRWGASAAGERRRRTARDLFAIAAPLALTSLVQMGAQFPLLAIVSLFGPQVVAAFVIALRVRDLLNTPGWGFGLASSSLVGQALGQGREREATAYGRDVLRFALAVYIGAAAVVFVLAEPVGRLFTGNPAVAPTAAALIRATCVSVVFWGLMNGALGPLRAGGDTQWPFYGQALGLFVFALPAAYLGATTALGLAGLYAALVLETIVPAAVTYARYRSGRWRVMSRAYRPA
ncbi:MAG: MATE family efflux transporter [Bacteroidetes bacterium QS_8_68_15]|nr:MAG: MATE family efflux transporter [Bacteroidetes bacterium QS_8_68_15]